MGGRSPVQQARRRDRVRVDDSLHDRLGGEELFNDGRLREFREPLRRRRRHLPINGEEPIYLSSGGSRSSSLRPVVVSSSNWLCSSPQSDRKSTRLNSSHVSI